MCEVIIEIGGGTGGFKKYMENGAKVGRKFHRNQLDQRVPLIGDLNVFELALSLHAGVGRAYDHITLSFSEHHVGNEMLQIAVNDFLDHALYAWPDSDRDLIPTYAEGHRPRLLSYVSSGTRELILRFTHIHIGIGRHNIVTGEAVEPLGYLGPRADNLKFLDAWQESFNSRYGFTSPKSNPRIGAFDTIDAIARYEGAIPDESFLGHGAKVAFESMLQRVIVETDVTTWAEFGELLATFGVVSRVNERRFGEFYRVKLADSGMVFRLKGVFFQRRFIELATVEKIKILKQRASSTYLEQMLPRSTPAYVSDILTEWQDLKAKEFRYLNTGSAYYKNVYLPANTQERLTILHGLERNSHDLPRHPTFKNRAIATAASRLPALQIRTLDGIRERTEMLLQADGRLDVRIQQAAESMGTAVRRPNSRRAQSDCEAQECVVQPSSVLERAVLEMEERHERCVANDYFCEIQKRLDCKALLANLKHSHGLNPTLYGAMTARDGSVRIRCGSRSLTPVEFLTFELGLPWREAAPILQRAHEHQALDLAKMQDVNAEGLMLLPAAEEKPLNGEVEPGKYVATELLDAVSVSNDTVDQGSIGSGLIEKVQSEIVGTAVTARARKSRRRASDHGL